MCEIQFIKRLDNNLSEKDLKEFFKLMLYGSVNNSDSFGFFNDKLLYKKKGIFNLKGFKRNKSLLNSNFLVGHNRLSTNGMSSFNYNNHPFILNDFVLVHNGVLRNYKEIKKEYKIETETETDSYVILWLINYFFKKNKENILRREKIIKAIKKTTNLIDGSYSVFLYDKEENNLYYFKDKITDFSFCLFDNKILIGTTNKKNLNLLYLNKKYIFDKSLFNEKLIKEIKEDKIYLINDNEIIREIGSFKEKKSSTYCYNGYSWYDDSEDFENLEDFEDYKSFNNSFNQYSDSEDKKSLKIFNFFRENIGFIPEFYLNGDDVLIWDDSLDDELLKYLFDDFEKKEYYYKVSYNQFHFKK